MANEKKAVCGGFLIGDGLQMDGKVLSASGDGGKLLVVHVIWEGDEPEADKTYNEIKDAYDNGFVVFAEYYGEVYHLDGFGGYAARFSEVVFNQYTSDSIAPIPMLYKQLCITNDNKIIEGNGVGGLIFVYEYLNKSGSTYKLFYTSPKNIYENDVKKNHIPVFIDRESSYTEIFNCEYSAPDKLVLSRRYVEDDGTVKMDILTATGETTSTFTKVTKTIA